MRPADPHRIVQKIADTSNANEEIPVFAPYSHGSTKLAMTISRPANSRNTSKGGTQLVKAASESAIGSVAAIMVPAYGTMRRMPATTPHSAGVGTPIRYRPNPNRIPKAALTKIGRAHV